MTVIGILSFNKVWIPQNESLHHHFRLSVIAIELICFNRKLHLWRSHHTKGRIWTLGALSMPRIVLWKDTHKWQLLHKLWQMWSRMEGRKQYSFDLWRVLRNTKQKRLVFPSFSCYFCAGIALGGNWFFCETTFIYQRSTFITHMRIFRGFRGGCRNG